MPLLPKRTVWRVSCFVSFMTDIRAYVDSGTFIQGREQLGLGWVFVVCYHMVVVPVQFGVSIN